MNKRIVHDALILTAFTLALGLILGFVYGITKDPIAKANEEATKAAYQAVFVDADDFNEVDYEPEKRIKLYNKLITENKYKVYTLTNSESIIVNNDIIEIKNEK